jgi:hypothetical protein
MQLRPDNLATALKIVSKFFASRGVTAAKPVSVKFQQIGHYVRCTKHLCDASV